jgi:hypothetical protein
MIGRGGLCASQVKILVRGTRRQNGGGAGSNCIYSGENRMTGG